MLPQCCVVRVPASQASKRATKHATFTLGAIMLQGAEQPQPQPFETRLGDVLVMQSWASVNVVNMCPCSNSVAAWLLFAL